MAISTARIVLEPAAQEFVEATAKPPFLFDLPPAEGRKAVDDIQSGEIAEPANSLKKSAIALTEDRPHSRKPVFVSDQRDRRPRAERAQLVEA